MKKFLGAVLCLAVILSAVPVAASAADTASVIDKHGAKTYIGLASDWNVTWNADKFTEITGQDYSCSGNITVKSGDVKNLTVTGGTSTLTVAGGNFYSIASDGNVTLNGGYVYKDVQSDQKLSLSGKLTIGGSCTAQDVSATGSDTVNVGGTVTGTQSIALNSTGIKANGFSGNGSGTLDIKDYKLTLPPLTGFSAITLTGNCTANGKIETQSLTLAQKAEFTAYSTIEVGSLSGPGTLSYLSGRLLVRDWITNKPLIRFLNTVGDGTLAFRAGGAVSGSELLFYDYTLDKRYDGTYDSFYLKDTMKDGVSLSSSSAAVGSKTPVELKASTHPDFSRFAAGTKMVWELHGETTAFSISPDSTKNTCKVSLAGSATGSHSATLTAYLVDQHGDRLADYKSGSCILSAGGDQAGADNSGLRLDTTAVTIPAGTTYSVLAITDAAKPPVQLSYNSSVATVGAAKAYSSGSVKGWLYPVNGVAKGAVTIDIGGKKMITTVANGAIVDTSSFTMAPGGKYCIGVRLYGIDKKSLNVHSANSCTTVQYGGSVNGLELYSVLGEQSGIGAVIFELPNGQSVRTQINVISGESPHGESARLIVAG